MIALAEESLGTLGNDYSGSLLLPFYVSSVSKALVKPSLYSSP